MQLALCSGEPNIEKPTGFSEIGGTGAPAGNTSIVHPEQDHNRKFASLCAMQRRKIDPVIPFAQPGKQAKCHVLHVTFRACSLNESVERHSFLSHGPAAFYQLSYKTFTKVLQPPMQTGRTIPALPK